MTSQKWIAICLSLCTTGSLQAGTATLELQHLPVTKFVEQWVLATEASAADSQVQKAQTSSSVMLNGTRVEIDERKNSLTIHGGEEEIVKIKELAKALDFEPISVQLNCVRLRVKLAGGANALDLLREGKGGGAVFTAEEQTLEALLKKAGDSVRAEVLSNLKAVCASNEEASFTISSRAGEKATATTVVVPLVSSNGQVTLSVAETKEKGGSESSMNSKITIPDGATALIGGFVEKDSAGNSVESALLIQANVLKKVPK